jgi:protein-S-isoprenylcysteine O-methyltransferase Ste14
METSPKAAGAYYPMALIFLGGLVVGVVANLYFPIPVWPGRSIQFFGIVPLAVGLWLFAWSRATFRSHRTALMPWTPSAVLVQDGPYELSRNPIYLAFALLYLSASLLLNSAFILAFMVLTVVLFDRTQIPREERYLQEKFGEEYFRYKKRVRRWI